MRKILITLFILVLTTMNVFAYAIKVYDEYGNRMGTYRKEGDKYQFYDFNDKKVDTPSNVIKNAPSDKTLTQYTRTFYDENNLPVGTWYSGYYGSNGIYYPVGYFYPVYLNHNAHGSPEIVRPAVNNEMKTEHNQTYKPGTVFVNTKYPSSVSRIQNSNPARGTYYVNTKYPAMHQFVK